ncbi:hydroxylysine kinase-like [Anguilla anguilla]|uniref:hydroxylysine kinase-like n=1 Tax=Anguilla anguilla TaxID=7936 RepID=UPI0015AF3039|nr:hydroxylysine kinase-like [Anguilla anguilla]
MSIAEVQPMLSESQASELIGRLFGWTVSKIRPLPSYYDQNFHVVVSEGGEYVLKITNFVLSRNLDTYEVENHTMAFMHQHGLPVQTVLPMLTGTMMSLENIDCGSGSQKYLVRLLSYLPGTTISTVPCSPLMLYQVGRIAATMDTILQRMEHPKLSALQRENNLWDLGNVHLLEPYLPALEGEENRVVKDIMNMFKTQVLPNMSSFHKCTIHGDFSDHNILVEPDDVIGYRISGILDFAEISSGYYVLELAISIMYMMTESRSPLEIGGAVLAGFESVFPLNEAERDALYVLVLVRFCQSLVLAHYSVTLYPENKEYLMVSAGKGVGHLFMLWKMGKEAVLRKWVEDAREYSETGSDDRADVLHGSSSVMQAIPTRL